MWTTQGSFMKCDVVEGFESKMHVYNLDFYIYNSDSSKLLYSNQIVDHNVQKSARILYIRPQEIDVKFQKNIRIVIIDNTSYFERNKPKLRLLIKTQSSDKMIPIVFKPASTFSSRRVEFEIDMMQNGLEIYGDLISMGL